MQAAFCLYSLAHPELIALIHYVKAIGDKVFNLCIQEEALPFPPCCL